MSTNGENKMSLKSKIRNMSASEILYAMLHGAKKQHIELDSRTFGWTDGERVCGCFASNAICEITGVVYPPSHITHLDDRAYFQDSVPSFLGMFEVAINHLRLAEFEFYNHFAQDILIAEIPKPLPRLPILSSGWHDYEYEDWIAFTDGLVIRGY